MEASLTRDVDQDETPEEAADRLPPIIIPTVVARPDKGQLKGRTIVFRLPPTRMWIAQQRGTFTNLDLWEQTLDAVVEHDLGIDLDAAPPDVVAELAAAWLRAVKEGSLPPTNGDA